MRKDGNEQQKEIETIKERTIKLKLSNADCERITLQATSHGITVAELLENFIGDLVEGTYSNGSDERRLASEWFERCWFGMFPDVTFISFLQEEWELDNFITGMNDMQDLKADIEATEKEMNDPEYNWKDICTYSKGEYIPCYKTKEDWIQDCKDDIKDYQEDYDRAEQDLKELCSRYNEKAEKKLTFEECIAEVKKYINDFNNLKGGE